MRRLSTVIDDYVVRVVCLVCAPYFSITVYLLPGTLPGHLAVHYGEPIFVEGTGNEDDTTSEHKVEEVKERIAELIEHGERVRSER